MIILDSDVIIDLLQRRGPTTDFVAKLREAGEEIGTTSVNAAEVLRGAHRSPAALRATSDVLAALPQVPVGPATARRYGQIMDALDKAGRPIGVTDGLIAAATLEAGGRLVTRNAKEYARVPGLEILSPK